MSYIPLGRDNKLQSYLIDKETKNNIKTVENNLNQSISNINNSIETINTQINNINTQINNINTQIQQIQQDISYKLIAKNTTTTVNSSPYLSYTDTIVAIGDLYYINLSFDSSANGTVTIKSGTITISNITINTYMFYLKDYTLIVKSIGSAGQIFIATTGGLVTNINMSSGFNIQVDINLSGGYVRYGNIVKVR